MRFAKLMIALATLLGAALLVARAADLAMNEAPYSPIVARNIFGLLPIPTTPPVDVNANPGPPPPKIVPNGLMSLFGVPQALFKASYPAAGGQPAHDQSYMLAQGEAQDNIEVVKIDMARAVVTFNNNGTVQELPLAAAPKITAPAGPVSNPGGGIGGGPSGIPRPMIGGRPRVPVDGSAPASSSSDGGANTSALGASTGNSHIYNPASEDDGLSADARALLIEKNYMDAKQNPNSRIPPGIFPPTPLRAQADASLNGTEGQ